MILKMPPKQMTNRWLASAILAMSSLSLGLSESHAGTLSACGWRGTTNMRCYEETNGCFNYQPEATGTCKRERYWSGGVSEAKPWCLSNGGAWLPANDSLQLSERCTLP